MDWTTCPECAEPAEIEWRDVVESTDGPVELAKVRCVGRHWFLLPLASLADRGAGADSRPGRAMRGGQVQAGGRPGSVSRPRR
jgi:hypothetical protein